MDTQLHAMSLAELKKAAKGRRIKHYYIMPRAELLHLLSLPELPKSNVIEKLTILQLRAEAKTKGIHGFWTMNRGDLVKLLYPLSEDKNDNSHQHDSPNDSDCNQQRA